MTDKPAHPRAELEEIVKVKEGIEEQEDPHMPPEELKAILESFFLGVDKVKPEDLPKFVEQVMGTVGKMSQRDGYNAAPSAVAACAVAAAWAANSHEEGGGITGFQASFVMWEFIRRWMHKTTPMRLLDYGEMLFPQYEDHFDRCIDKSTWEWLQKETRKNLAKESHGSPGVRAHWEKIAAGHVPFGFTVRER